MPVQAVPRRTEKARPARPSNEGLARQYEARPERADAPRVTPPPRRDEHHIRDIAFAVIGILAIVAVFVAATIAPAAHAAV
jgi:hypothetical protein